MCTDGSQTELLIRESNFWKQARPAPPVCNITLTQTLSPAPQVRGNALALQPRAQLLDGLGERLRARLCLAQPPAQALPRSRARALLRLRLARAREERLKSLAR